MYRSYRFMGVLMLVCILAMLSGCIGSSSSTTSDTIPSAQSGKSVVDSLGRRVQIPEKVEKIGCLYAMSGQIVVMLGKGSNIVAVADGLKRDVLLTQLAPNIKTAAIPSHGGAINIEELLKVKPDVVFISADVAKNPVEAGKLEKSRIPYVVVDCKSVAEQQQVIEMIGAVVGNSERAHRYNDYYKDTINRVQKQVASIPQNAKTRIYHSINEATRTDISKTLSVDLLEYAGVTNVSVTESGPGGDAKFFVNVEQILLWEPDAIIVNEKGVVEQIVNDTQWAALKAVKQGKVYQMPVGISRWGHPGSIETPLGILWTAKTIYPDRFADVNLALETKRYYKEFFGMDLTDDGVAMILEGKGKLKKGTGNHDISQ